MPYTPLFIAVSTIITILVILTSIGVLLYIEKHPRHGFKGGILMKTCDDVMTKVPTYCLPDDMATKAASLMKSENIGSILVINNEQDQKLVGIVTDRDLALTIVAKGNNAKSTKVETVMTRKVVTYRANDDLQKALDAMSRYQLRRIPVVDKDNRILGIIAQADVATRVNQPEKTAAMVKGISRSTTK